jgi:hypothetical protein
MDEVNKERIEDLEEQLMVVSKQITNLQSKKPFYVKYCGYGFAVAFAALLFCTNWELKDGNWSIDYNSNQLLKFAMGCMSLGATIYGVKQNSN